MIIQNCDQFCFTWDWQRDRAELCASGSPRPIWTGSLLPLFWVREPDGSSVAVKATPSAGVAARTLGSTGGVVPVDVGRLGRGWIHVEVRDRQLFFARILIEWHERPPPLIAMYFGCNPLTELQRCSVPSLERAFWPDWRADGFAVPSAKTSPMQSFFRRWDFGHANIPLGSFGPAMGVPYAAAFPRPVFAAAMGSDDGCICLGAGSIPDAALTLQIRSSSGALEWLFREDLWGTPAGTRRTWDNPLWLSWATTAWDAYLRYFRAFERRAKGGAKHQLSFMGTWGDFRARNFDLRSTIDRTVDEMGGEVLCIDDPWESFMGSGEVHRERLPRLDEEIDYARRRGLRIGIWQSAGWIADYKKAGLTPDDLLLRPDGLPTRANWAMDPHVVNALWFCLDPSSARARAYLHDRTVRLMRRHAPDLLKLDFSYGMPGPDVCSPRDPALRGERLAYSLLNTIAAAAREVNPSVTIMGYSIHPLWQPVADVVSLDDLGDAGRDEAGGHGHWSVWAALVADRGAALMASSGYDWDADAAVLLNTIVLGAPGANLPRERPDGKPVSPANRARRLGVARWYRRETRWQPLWLDSSKGGFREEPQVRSWGRLEPHPDGPRLTAVALREPSEQARSAPELKGLDWTGYWGLIAQDDRDIFETATMAAICFVSGQLDLPRRSRPRGVWLVTPRGETPWRHWSWQSGWLRIDGTPLDKEEPVLGFLVRS